MYHEMGGRHHYPHVHVEYAEYEDVYKLEQARIMEGFLPRNKEKLVQDWILKKEKELLQLWNELNRSNVTVTVFKIDA